MARIAFFFLIVLGGTAALRIQRMRGAVFLSADLLDDRSTRLGETNSQLSATSDTTATVVGDAAAAQNEGKRSRQKLIDALLDVLTGDTATSEQLAELRSCWLWFPEGRKLVSEICALYSDPKEAELKKTVLLSAILACLEKLA